MDLSSKLLFVLALVFIFHVLFAVAMLQDGQTVPRWVLFYLITVAFFGALYYRRQLCLRGQRRGVYHGLGYTAVVLGSLLSALFFFSVAPWNALPLAVLVWLILAVAAYFLHRVTVLHLEDEEVIMRAPL